MSLFGKKIAVGLELDTESIRILVLSQDGVRETCLDHRQWDGAAGTPADRAEIYAKIAAWLHEKGFPAGDIAVSLPQHFGSVQVSDFPPGSSGELERMVSFETRQLSGLSEETFTHDYHPLNPVPGWNNPVLIALYRTKAVRDELEVMATAGLYPMAVTLSGLAAANACFYFYPDTVSSPQPRLLLQVGDEGSLMMITAQGQVVFASPLQAGTGKDLRSFEMELQSALDQWRAHDRPELVRQPFEKVALIAPTLAKLDALLLRMAQAPVERIGVFLPGTGRGMEPGLMTVYGLALQALGRSRIPLSLDPPDLRSQSFHHRRFPYLATGIILLLGLLGLSLGRSYVRLVAESRRLDRNLTEVNQCQSLAPQLESLQAEIQLQEKMLLPLVEKAGRGGRFLRAIQELNANRGRQNWMIYLADEESFQKGRKNMPPPPAPEPPKIEPAAKTPAAALTPFVAPRPDVPPGGGERSFNGIPANSVQPLAALVAAGFTPLLDNEPYKPIRDIVTKLNRVPANGVRFFQNADLIPETERTGREEIFDPWLALFNDLKEVAPETEWRYKSFVLRLPFATHDIMPGAEGGNR